MDQSSPSRSPVGARRAFGALASCVILAGILAHGLPDVPVGDPRTSAAEGMVVGAFHMHTVASDGGGTVEDLVDAARAHGLDFIVVTDHNTGDFTRYEYRRGVLVVHGEEVSAPRGHVVVLDVDSARAAETAEIERRHGLAHPRGPGDAGVRIVAHPNGRRSWRDRSLSHVDGLEIWNADSEWRNDGVLDWMEALILLPFRPSLAMLALVDRPAGELALLDSASAGRTLAATCAVDAHARIALTDDWFVPFPSYRMALGLVHQHLPLPVPPTGDAAIDGPRLVKAIRDGGGYCALGGIADDGAVRIEQVRRGIAVSLPGDVPRARIRVYRAGTVLAEEEGHHLFVPTPKPGMYRVEVEVRARLIRSRWIPWILSGPLWVGPSPDDPPAHLLGTFEDDYGNRYTITREAWIQEPDVRYEVDRWYGSRRFLVARNGEGNAEDVGLWTRIDWIELGGAGNRDPGVGRAASSGGTGTGPEPEWRWAFCLSRWDARSRSEARRADGADPTAPRTGCGGFPFSRMRRIDQEPGPRRGRRSAA